MLALNLIIENYITLHPDCVTTIREIKVLMHDPIRAKYPFATLTEAMIRMLNIKQMENEGLMGYVKRFKQSHDITKSHVGTDILDKFVENTREYQDEADILKKDTLKEKAFQKWMAYLLMRNSDQNKYGTLLNGLISQFSMENNQYPKNIVGATDILSNHKHDRKAYQGNQSSKKSWYNSKPKDDDSTPSTISTTASETSFAQNPKEQMCYCCGKKGHISPECPNKNTFEKKDWYIRKAEQHMIAEQDESKENESTTDSLWN
jgi:hypothetical protein